MLTVVSNAAMATILPHHSSHEKRLQKMEIHVNGWRMQALMAEASTPKTLLRRYARNVKLDDAKEERRNAHHAQDKCTRALL